MFLGSRDPDFPALLKGADGDVLAEGQAVASVEERVVTFTSDFVPLYPKGTLLEIDRLFKGREVHRFIGKVYLSDKTFMRLVNADDELLPGAEEAYCGGMSYPATLTTPPPRKRPKLFARLFPKPTPSYPIVISALTSRQFEFQQDMHVQLEEGQHFTLTVAPPIPLPPNTTVRISKAMLFGATASYLCDFVGLSPEDEAKLHTYLILRTVERYKFHD